MTEYPQVLTKRDFVQRYAAGEFGNASPTWNNLEAIQERQILEFIPSDQLYHVRNRIEAADTWYNILPEDLADCWYNAVKAYGSENLYISEMAPTEKTLFQGECFHYEKGLQLIWTDVAKPMRDALKEKLVSAEGIIALELIRFWLCPKSMDWMEVLWDRYPGHVVEFSTYSLEWGTLPGYNTVFWEVRNY